jgi:hypothetical protein
VTFTASDGDSGEFVNWDWDLNNDGAFGEKSGRTITHSYFSTGKFAVWVRAYDALGNTYDRKRTIEVVSPSGNKRPEASFVVFPTSPIAGLPLTLVSTSIDPDSAIPATALQWDLNGDGAFNEAVGPSVTTTFPVPGLYPVGLQVSTNAKSVATLLVPVAAPGAGLVHSFSLMNPFPVVRIVGRTSDRGARIRRLTVNAPPGSSVSVRCQGRGCPFKRTRQTVSMRALPGALPATRLTRVRRLEGHTLRTGAMLRVFVTRADVIGKYTRFRIRKDKPPARIDMCLVPGNTRPGGCSAR